MQHDRTEQALKVGVVLTFFGPGCWMWQTDDGGEGVAGSREQALEDAKAAVQANHGSDS